MNIKALISAKQYLSPFLFASLFLLIILVDQIIKVIVLALPNRYNFVVFSDFFEIKTFYNYNLSFLNFIYLPVIIYLSSTFIVFFIFYKYIYSPLKIKNGTNIFLLKLGAILVISGALSNLSDRIRFGFVVDYLFIKWPANTVFNIADIAILLGSLLLIKEIIKTKF